MFPVPSNSVVILLSLLVVAISSGLALPIQNEDGNHIAIIILVNSVILNNILILSPSVEYDPMHPQLAFNMFRSGLAEGRAKRAALSLTFTPPAIEKYADYWNNVGQNTLKTQLHKNYLNKRKAKNVILFIGDGMSIPTLTATRVYMGGESKQLSFETYPYSGLSKVSARDNKADSD